MAPWIIPVASFLANRSQQSDQREQMRQQIMQQYASSLGAQPYEMQAANFNKQQRDANGGMPNILSLIQLAGNFGGGGAAVGPRSGAMLSRDQF
jgi:hypothetical protein